MSGIVGIASFDASLERARAIASTMCAPLAHRAADADEVVAHPDATLAMHRLSSPSVARGRPLSSDDESVVIAYCGTIANAPEVRTALERSGVRFRTHEDAELILRLYEQSPEAVEGHLVGSWAFALHDRKRRRVVLSRDRFGIEPLFVADTGRALAFASDLRCFDRSLKGFGRLFELDHDAAHAMLSWSYVPEAATIYKGVRRLPPATRLTIDLASGDRHQRLYWELEPCSDAARIRSLDEACEATDALLRRAVKEHLRSDVPVATFLSGGIDSSLVTAYAHDLTPDGTKAYAIGFEEAAFDESPFARETAERLGAPLSVGVFDERTALAKLPDALLAYDEPFGDSSSLATYLLCEHVAGDYTVALGGDGSDEIFAGYKKYFIAHLRKPFSSTPILRDALGHALGRLPSVTDRTRGWANLLRTARRVARGLEGSDAWVYAQLTQVASLERTAPLMQRSADPQRFEREAEARFERARGTELQRTLTADLGGVLSNDMLVKVHRASKPHGLDVRVPFLDHRVAEFGLGLPPALTLGEPTRRWAGKRVLRRLHERRFGAQLARRKKMGFGVPVEKWLRGPFAPACERLFDRRRLERYGVLSSAELADGGHLRWVGIDPLIVWHSFTLAAWCEVHLGDGARALHELIPTL